VLIVLSLVLTAGISAHIRRRLANRATVDEVDEP
jgi:hypothetical protein